MNKLLTILAALMVMMIGQMSQAGNFSEAKKYLSKNLDVYNSKTIYCGCRVVGKKIDLNSCNYKVHKDAKRAARMEFEHVVPAEAFGQSFSEWRTGGPKCHGKKGRKCAGTNPEYARMEGDVYNLYPEDGELNGLRSNYTMAEIPNSTFGAKVISFGGCSAKVSDRKFEPMDMAKGVVARTYLNFEHRYPGHGIVSNKNEKLFAAWNKMYPLSKDECRRWKALERFNGYEHLFAKECR